MSASNDDERFGNQVFLLTGRPREYLEFMLQASTFGLFVSGQAHRRAAYVDENILDPRNLLYSGCMVSNGSVIRNYSTYEVPDLEGSTLFQMASAHVPSNGGAVHLEVMMTLVSCEDSEHSILRGVEPVALSLMWSCLGDADHRPVLSAVMEWVATLGMAVEEQAEPRYSDDDISESLSDVVDRISFLETTIRALADGPVMKAKREEEQKHRKVERKLTGHVDQLKTELETQKAVSARQRQRADDAEKRARNLGAAGTALSVTDNQTSQLLSRIADLEHESAGQEHAREQQDQEIDRLRGETFRLREQLARSQSAPTLQTLDIAGVTPPDLRGLATWAGASLGGRVVLHQKATRAARKSNFADHGLVYRVLQAMADLYWPMRFDSNTKDKSAWEAFLAQEHLSCGFTGAAVSAHRTAETYQVSWHRQSVPLDLHIQGHSGRDEARTFRLYFHVDEDRRVIVVGHLPSHLPSTHS